READERGEFDNLPGKGTPIPDLDQPYDEQWWVRSWMKREGLQWLPDTLQLRLDVERDVGELKRLRSAAAVRDEVEKINERIRFGNRRAVNGPPSDLYVLDPDRVVADWEAGRLGVREDRERGVAKPGVSRAGGDGDDGHAATHDRRWMDPLGRSAASVAGGESRAMTWALVAGVTMLLMTVLATLAAVGMRTS
ncbi:MAG: DUF1992 domain-containing protein, partial [Planctomycetota bacterium]